MQAVLHGWVARRTTAWLQNWKHARYHYNIVVPRTLIYRHTSEANILPKLNSQQREHLTELNLTCWVCNMCAARLNTWCRVVVFRMIYSTIAIVVFLFSRNKIKIRRGMLFARTPPPQRMRLISIWNAGEKHIRKIDNIDWNRSAKNFSWYRDKFDNKTGQTGITKHIR